MSDLFFYGTLRHGPLLDIVLGADHRAESAVLHDHAVYWAKDQIFPLIVEETGAQTQGILLRGLSAEQVARLDYYEGGFAYDLRPVIVQADTGDHVAQVYFPQQGAWEIGAPWSLDHWVRDHGELSCLAATEAMERMGTTPPDVLQRFFPVVRARAWARMLAKHGAPTELRGGRDAKDVEVMGTKPGFDGFFRVRNYDVRFRKFDGQFSGTMPRETFMAFDAALLLPYDPVNDLVMLIEQVRFATYMRGDPQPWVLEPVAGLVDAGEDPETCARREAVEEAGLHVDDVIPMVQVYASPGYSTEFFHCFLGLCDLSDKGGGIGGLDTEHEDIKNHVIGFDDAMALVDSGEVNAGPLAMMLLWLARYRAERRAQA